MADKKISQLTELTTVDSSNDVLAIVDFDASETKKVKPQNFPISDATQTALDLKADASAVVSATETTEGLVELATEAEVLGVSNVDAVVRAKHMRVKVETANGNAVSIGDLGGNARGSGSVTIQAARTAATQVASGANAVAIGTRATASGIYATALGNGAIATGDGAAALGYNASALNNSATALGNSATASGENATALGNSATAFGYRAKSATANVQELGYWSNSTTRAGAVRVHGTGYVAISTPQTDTAFTDGGATAGSEADGTIFRKGLAFRVSVAGNLIATYCKADGTIITKDLGAMT
jgi:trimeric autotransporter adhesin